MNTLDFLLRLAEITIWPITVLTIFYWFKKELKGFFDNLKTVEATTSGIKLEAFEEKLAKAKSLLTKMPKSKSAIEIGGQSYSKSSQSISNRNQVQNWNEALLNKITTKAGDSNMNPTDALNQLNKTGKINFNTFQAIEAILDTTESLPEKLTNSQLSDFQKMYNTINL